MTQTIRTKKMISVVTTIGKIWLLKVSSFGNTMLNAYRALRILSVSPIAAAWRGRAGHQGACGEGASAYRSQLMVIMAKSA